MKIFFKFFNNTRTLADELFVIVNNYHQRALTSFRRNITNDHCFEYQSSKTILSINEDRTVFITLQMIAEYGSGFKLAFAIGSDQNNDTFPNWPISKEVGIALIDGLVNKIQPRSWLLNK